MATVNYLDRFLEPMTRALTPAAARAIADWRADEELERRVEELRHKAETGTLTAAEAAEYKEFVEAVDVISIIQAKARRLLAAHEG